LNEYTLRHALRGPILGGKAGDIDDRQILVHLAGMARDIPTADIAAELHIGNEPTHFAGIFIKGRGCLLAALDEQNAKARVFKCPLHLAAGNGIVFHDQNEDRAALHAAHLRWPAPKRRVQLPRSLGSRGPRPGLGKKAD